MTYKQLVEHLKQLIKEHGRRAFEDARVAALTDARNSLMAQAMGRGQGSGQ